jgi:hypothetical protein
MFAIEWPRLKNQAAYEERVFSEVGTERRMCDLPGGPGPLLLLDPKIVTGRW